MRRSLPILLAACAAMGCGSASPDGPAPSAAPGAAATAGAGASGTPAAAVVASTPAPPRSVVRLGTTRLALPGRIRSLDLAEDGRTVVALATDGTLVLRDATTGDPRAPSLKYPGRLAAVAVSPDGRRVALAGSAKLVVLWDLATDTEAGRLDAPGGNLADVAWSPDGALLYAVGDDGPAGARSLFEWRLADRSVRRLLEPSSTAALHVVRGGRIHTRTEGSSSEWFRLPELVSLGTTNDFSVVLASADGRRALSAGTDLATTFHNLAGGPKLELEKPPRDFLGAAFSPDGKHLVAGDLRKVGDRSAGLVRIWSAETGKLEGPPLVTWDRAEAFAFTPDGRRLAIAGYETKAVVFWDLASRAPAVAPEDHAFGIEHTACATDGTVVTSSEVDGDLIVWDGVSGALRRRLGAGAPAVAAVALAADGALVAAGTIADGAVRGAVVVWDARSGALVRRLELRASAVALAFSPDGRRLASYESGRLTLWDPRAGTPVWAVDLERTPDELAFSRDGKTLFGSGDHALASWDAATGKPAPGLPVRGGVSGAAAAFSPDGRRLAVPVDDGGVVIANRASGATERTVTHAPVGDRAPEILAVAFAADGKSLYSIDDAGALYVWDLATYGGRRTLLDARGLRAAAVSPDAKTLVTSSGDFSASVWPLETLGAGEGDHPMVLVPAGAYPYGSDPARDPARFADEEADDAPRALPAFYVETFEYPDRRDEPPLASVSWRDARALCDARGRRLCTEPEWEAACEGPAGAVYGYGDAFAGGTCAAGDPAGAIALSGAYDKCVSPFGAFDLPGNLSEWTLGAWTKAAGKVVARSGAFASEPRVLRCANRIPKGPDEKSPRFGFRCCLSVDAAGVRPGEDVDGDRGESYVWSDGAAVYPKPDRHAGVELGKLRARTRVVPVEIVNLPDGNYGLIRVETPIGGGWMDVDALAPWLRVDLDGDGAAELVLVRPAPCTKKPAKCDGELVVGEGTGAGTTVALPGLGGLRPSTLELHSYGSGASSVRFLAVSADDFVVFYRLDGDRTARLASYRATHLRVTVQFPAAEDPAPLTIHVFDGEWDGSTGHIIEILYEWDGTALTEF